MASMGSGNVNAIPITRRVVSAYTPSVPGTNMGTTKNLTIGSGGSSVTPKRYVNVSGSAVAIQ